MSERTRSARGVLAAVTLLTTASITALTEGIAFAGAEDREQCANSAEQAQQLRDEGKYRRAREQMLVCARDLCPGPIKSDCGKWLSELDRDAPTVVFGARDGKGNDLVDTRVSMDGAVIQERLDGKPVLVDAGEHTFKFEIKGGATKEERVLVRTAEKARAIVASFGAPPEKKVVATPSDPSKTDSKADKIEKAQGSLVPAFLVGGIGVVALGSFAIFGLGGKSDVDDLQKCKPNCAPGDVDSARSKLIIADISLGVGLVALGVATYMFVTRPTVDVTKVQTRTGANTLRSSLHLDAAPLAGGGFAGLSGRF